MLKTVLQFFCLQGGAETPVWSPKSPETPVRVIPGRPELERDTFWAEELEPKPQIDGGNQGIRPWERRGRKINSFTKSSTDQNLPKLTQITDRSKTRIGAVFGVIFEFMGKRPNRREIRGNQKLLIPDDGGLTSWVARSSRISWSNRWES